MPAHRLLSGDTMKQLNAAAVRHTAVCLVTGTVFLAVCLHHTAAAQGIAAAGERCVQVLVPSLYFYAVLAGLAVSGGMLRGMARMLRPVCRLLRVDGELLSVLLFSQIGGYPVGAQLLHGMRLEGRISPAQEQRLVCVCMGAGPGFVLGTVGAGLPGRTALWLLMSVCLPDLVLGICLLRGECTRPPVSGGIPRFAVLVTQAAGGAARAMLRICAMVLLFGGVMPLLEPVMSPAWPWRSVLEVSFLGREALPLPAAAALLAFGGICVHCQIAAIGEGRLPWGRFLACRCICAVLSGLLCRAGLLLFPQALPVMLMEGTAVRSSAHPLPGLCLLLMSVLLVLHPGGVPQGKKSLDSR